MPKFTAEFDERTNALLDELSRSEALPKSHIIRRSVALLKRAMEARDEGLRLTLTDADDRVRKELVF